MGPRTFQIAAIIGAVALVTMAGLTFIATAGGSEGPSSEFFRHIHKLGHHLHGGGDHHDQMARMIEQLELTPEQYQRLENVHEIIGTDGSEEPGAMAELHDKLMAQVEQGQVENAEIRRLIDGHVEQIRERAYAVTDELIALVNGLDATQREKLLAHLRGAHQRGHGNGI